MNKTELYAKSISAHRDVCHVEFNARKFSVRDAIKVVNRADIGDIVDIISDNKTHVVVINDCYECVYLREMVVGMNVYDRIGIMEDDNLAGITAVCFSKINYFNPEVQYKHEKACKIQQKGSLKSPDSDSDDSYEKNHCKFA